MKAAAREASAGGENLAIGGGARRES